MPEQLTKHPDVTLEVLRSAGAQCGSGAAPSILTACPAERFCRLPGGEICVYGLADAPRMTQLTPADWQAVVRSVAGGGPPPADRGLAIETLGGLLLLAVVAGAVFGRLWRRAR